MPFAYGGAEIFTDTLVERAARPRPRGRDRSVPFKWYPGTRVLTQAFLWRLLDLTRADGRPIDMVVATKFPSYVVRHPEKRVWLVHQFRQAYELDRTELGQFGESPEDRALRRQVQRARQARARRGDASLRDVRERRRAAGALDRARRRGAAPPAAGSRLPLRGLRRLRALRRAASTARSGSTCWSRRRRSTSRCASSSSATGPTASGSSGSPRAAGSTAASVPGRVTGEELADLYATLPAPSTTRRSTRTSAWVRTSRSSPGSR